MWGNFGNVVGAAIQKVKTLQTELEASMDAAVGADVDNTVALIDSMPVSAEAPVAPLHEASPAFPRDTSSVGSNLSITESLPHSESEGHLNSRYRPASENSTPAAVEHSTGESDSSSLRTLRQQFDSFKREHDSEVKRLKHAILEEQGRGQQAVAEAVVNAAASERDRLEKEFAIKSEAWDSEKAKLLKRVEDIKTKAKEQRLELMQKFEVKSKAVEEAAEARTLELRRTADSMEEKYKECLQALQAQKQTVQQHQLELQQAQVQIQQQQQQLSAMLLAEDARSSEVRGTGSSEADAEGTRTIAVLQDRVAALTADVQSYQQQALENATKLLLAENKVVELESAMAASSVALESRNTLVQELEAKLLAVTEDLQTLATQSQEEKYSADSVQEELQAKISLLELKLEETSGQVSISNTQIQQQHVTVSGLEAQLTAAREVITERERALESATTKMTESHHLLEEGQRRIADLQAEIAEKDSRLRSGQSAAQSEFELKKLIAKLQDSIKEKEDRLTAFEVEGQNLAKKQGEMEKAVRASKKEVKDKDLEIVKLKESKDQLVKAIEEMQDVMRKNESDASTTTKSLSAMQAVTQATSDKLSKLESELVSKTDELNSQRRALESAWADSNEQKRTIAELRAERDDLKRQIGEGTSKVMETESSRRDIEQREAVLRATSKQLQESLQRQMNEASSREERLREEANEMRKRWQEAITSRETMAAELGAATAPLLRQISTLQESFRSKSDSWQAVETSLTERALRAESAAEIATHKKSVVDEQLAIVKQQLATATATVTELQEVNRSLESSLEKMKRAEVLLQEKISELDSRLALEAGQRHSLSTSLREMESRHKMEVADLKEANELAEKAATLKCIQLQGELTSAKDKLVDEQRRTAEKAPRRQASEDFTLAQEEALSSVTTRLNFITMPETLPNGETSFAALQKGHQQQQRMLDDFKALQLQVHQLQVSRDYLSTKNAQLEEQVRNLPDLTNSVSVLKKRVEVLLLMLGEKEEELEAVIGDMKEVKKLYRSQLDDLLERVAPPSLPVTHSPPSKTLSPAAAVDVL